MNAFGIVILATLLVGYLLDIVSSALNLRSLREKLPEEFADVYDAERYARSQAYTRERTRLSTVASSFDLAIVLAFWFSGGFNWLDQLVRDWGFGPIVTGLLFIGLLILARTVLGLPFSIYSNFVIEERFGFNKTTKATFVADRIKGLILAVVIGVPLLAAILWFFETAGSLAWVYCWIITSAFALILQFVFPTWILPLFNKLEPLEEGELRSAIFDYARSVDFPLGNVAVMDGSKRSGKSNAFFSGFGASKRLVLYDTLIEQQSTDELVAVFAHEVGHYKHGHILQGLAISILHTGVLFFLLSLCIHSPGLFEAFYMEEMSTHAGLVFFGMLFAPVELVVSIALQAWSRRNEFQADRFAARTIAKAEDMVRALKNLSRENLVNLTPHPFHVFLHYSHPPMLQRIQAIRSVEPRTAQA